LSVEFPADFKTVDMPPVTDRVPPVTPWKQVLCPHRGLTFAVGRWRRPVAAALDVVRRFGGMPISSREHARTEAGR
jgi:hypothetical protein